MVISAGAVYAGAVAAAGAIFALEQENALLNGGSYVRDGQPEDLTGKIGQQLARRACLAYGADPDSVDGPAALKYERACRPYLDDIGGGAGPAIKPPFKGGQCGTTYLVYGQLDGNDQFIGGLTPRQLAGPFTLAGVREVAAPGQPFNDSRRTFYDFNTASGPETVGVAWRSDFPFPRSFRIERIDGQPDNCGDPPPEVVQPDPIDPPPNPAPIVIAPDVDINVGVVILAPGAIVFDFGGQEITVDPFAETGAGGPAPGDVGSPGTGVETGAGGDAEGEAPPGQVVVGVRVAIETPAPFKEPLQGGYFKGVCYVRFGTADGLSLEPSGGLLTDGQFVFAPKENLTRWRVDANVGFNLRVTPYYRALES